MNDAQKPASSTTGRASKGFTDEERAAMKERAQELKAAARRSPRADKADGESDVLAKIAEMPEPDRGTEAAAQPAHPTLARRRPPRGGRRRGRRLLGPPRRPPPPEPGPPRGQARQPWRTIKEQGICRQSV